MSTARSDRGHSQDPDAGLRDERNLLVVPIAKVAAALKPRVIVVENVPAFLTRLIRDPRTNEPISAARLLISYLSRDYEVFPVVCDLAEFGVPQTRKRAFLTFVRKGERALKVLDARGAIPYPKLTHCKTNPKRKPISLKQILASLNLPELDARLRETSVHPGRDLHFVPAWSIDHYAMVSAIPANSGRSAWQNTRCRRCRRSTENAATARCRWCRAVLPRPIVWDSGRARLVRGFRCSSYRRMTPDKPAPTVTTASGQLGSDTTIHPSENRVLSPLECAALQTFPKSFIWGDALARFGSAAIREMIGEAVPPLFTAKHGRVLYALLTGDHSASLLSVEDQRHQSVRRRLEQHFSPVGPRRRRLNAR